MTTTTPSIVVEGAHAPSEAQFSDFALQTLMYLVYGQRASLVEDQVRDLADAIQYTNEEIEFISAVLVLGKQYKANEWKVNDHKNDKFTDFISRYGQTDFVKDSDDDLDWDANNERISGVLDEKTNLSSQQTTRLQNLNNKYTNAYEVFTSFLKALHESKSGILDKL